MDELPRPHRLRIRGAHGELPERRVESERAPTLASRPQVNEFHGQTYPCASFVPSGPGYEGASGLDRVCSTVGSVAGSTVVNGDDYINTSFDYYVGHKWRNIGIIIAFISAFCCRRPRELDLIFRFVRSRFLLHLPRSCGVHHGSEEQGRGSPLPAWPQEAPQAYQRPGVGRRRHQDHLASSEGRQHDPSSDRHLSVGGRRL
jgi:hypothetical protein